MSLTFRLQGEFDGDGLARLDRAVLLAAAGFAVEHDLEFVLIGPGDRPVLRRQAGLTTLYQEEGAWRDRSIETELPGPVVWVAPPA